MTESPEIIRDESGKWVRKDVLISEMIEETGSDKEDVESALDDMIDHGPFNSMSLDGVVYVQLANPLSAVGYVAKLKAQMAAKSTADKVTRFLGGN